MFELNAYKKDCDRLTISRDTLEEMIFMTEQKKTKNFKPVRVALLTAALVAALGLTAAATDGPVKDFFNEIFLTFTVTTKDDGSFGMVSVNGDMVDFMTGISLPTMAYAEKDGRKILTLDGEELDVTEAMEKDGYYEQAIEGAILRVAADGMATITVYDTDGEVGMTYTVGLNEEGAASSFDTSSYWEGEIDEDGNIITIDGEPAGAYEVKGAYKITEKDGEMVVTDSNGNVVDLPQE